MFLRSEILLCCLSFNEILATEDDDVETRFQVMSEDQSLSCLVIPSSS